MEVENLTTGDNDPQVNVEEQDNLNAQEVMVDDTQNKSTNVDDSLSNEPITDTKEYDDAWDNLDLNDDSIFDRDVASTTETQPLEPAESNVDDLSTTNDTNNNIGAFMVEKPVLKYKGKDIPIDNESELISLAQKGFSYETEMANMKPKKKALGIIDGIPLEVLQAVADIHNGKPEAISYIKSEYGIKDTTASNNDDNFWSDKPEQVEKVTDTYTPEVAVENPIETFWNDYSSNNQSAAAKVSDVYGGLEESFKAELYRPEVFPAFVQSVETGEFEKAYPIAIKEISLNPAMTWLQAYQVAVGKIGVPVQQQTEPPAGATPPANTGAADRNISESAKADMVWNDDKYFQELESKLFG